MDRDVIDTLPYSLELKLLALDLWEWTLTDVLVVANLLQVLAIIVAYFAAAALAPRVLQWIDGIKSSKKDRYLGPALPTIQSLAKPFFWLLFVWMSRVGYAAADHSSHILRAMGSLLMAWIVIRVATSLMGRSPWSRPIATFAWTIAALNILGILDDTTQFLDGLALAIGDFKLSLLGAIKALAALILFLWLASLLARFTEKRLAGAANLTPSARVLLGKVFRVGLFAIAILIALDSVGIDLTTLTVFSGAVGLGVGFGLQKVVSNLISGVILLMDRSIKPGDVIVIGQTYGVIQKLGARYASVLTRDGTEHIIPNEELITQRVENWSFSSPMVRLKIVIGISYESDVPTAMDLCLQAATETKRVLDKPEPKCQLLDFGASSIDLELRIWVADPHNGISNVRSDVRVAIWKRFKESGVEFPYPQQDLHIRSMPHITIDAAKP
ncbi:MAG: mechanosensitive ion channel family protein [Magnetospiraceae bacterium]